MRREKGLQRAEANLDILEVKSEKSKGKGRLVKERSRAWDEVDSQLKGEKSKKKKKKEEAVNSQEPPDRMDEDEWEDEVDGVEVRDAPEVPSEAVTISSTIVEEQSMEDELDEIT